MSLTALVSITVGAIFVNNFVLTRFLGLCPFLGVSKRLSSAIGMGLAVMFVMTVATLFTWPIQRLVLAPCNLAYLRTIVFILVIAGLVQLLEMMFQRFMPALNEALGIYLPLITTNCAILAVAIIGSELNPYTGASFTLLEAVVNALMSGVGFTLALVLMAGIREKLELARVPKPLEGLPIAFVTAGLIALAFLGFAGFRLH